jgi:hypothetical protein
MPLTVVRCQALWFTEETFCFTHKPQILHDKHVCQGGSSLPYVRSNPCG